MSIPVLASPRVLSLVPAPAPTAYRNASPRAAEEAMVREKCVTCGLVHVTRGPVCARCSAPLLAAQWDLAAPRHPGVEVMERGLAHASLAVVGFAGALVAFGFLVLVSALGPQARQAAMPLGGVLLAASFLPFRLARAARWRGGEREAGARAELSSAGRGRSSAGVVRGNLAAAPSLLVVLNDAIVAVPLGFLRMPLASAAGIAVVARVLDDAQREMLHALDAYSDDEVCARGRVYPREALRAIQLAHGYRSTIALVTDPGGEAGERLRFFTSDDFFRARAVLAKSFPGIVGMQ